MILGAIQEYDHSYIQSMPDIASGSEARRHVRDYDPLGTAGRHLDSVLTEADCFVVEKEWLGLEVPGIGSLADPENSFRSYSTTIRRPHGGEGEDAFSTTPAARPVPEAP